jgi:CheY-like chemotaxis protein
VRQVRALPGFVERAPLIVAASGYPDAATRLATLRAPWVPLLQKPLALDALAQLLTTHLGGRRPEGV